MRITVLSLLVGLLSGSGVLATPCSTEIPWGALVAVKADGQYRVSVNPKYGRWPTAPKNASVAAVAQFFAREAGATLYLYTNLTARPVTGEWRGATPLETLRRFIEAVGLRLVVQGDLWLVIRDEPLEHFELSIFASRLDTEHFRPGIESDEGLERALLRELPIESRGYDGLLRVGVSYMPLPLEGPNLYLVLMSSSAGMASPGGRSIWAFKVRATPKGSGYVVDCLWPAMGVSGPVVDISEDFDGDGYRDFVFRTEDPGEAPDMILSGNDGHKLAAFLGSTLAVEVVPAGPKRFAAGMAWEELSGARVFNWDAENRRFEASGVDQARKEKVIRERSQSAYRTMIEDQAEAAKQEQASAQAKRLEGKAGSLGEYQTGELLRRDVGGAEKVRVYYMPGARRGERTTFEEIQVPVVAWDVMLAPEHIRAGSPGRVIYTYRTSPPRDDR